MNNKATIKQIACVGKASLELLCKLMITPSILAGNDWFCGLIPAYRKYGHFGEFFNTTTFFHIFHNLGIDYEGRIWPDQNVSEEQLNVYRTFLMISINLLWTV